LKEHFYSAPRNPSLTGFHLSGKLTPYSLNWIRLDYTAGKHCRKRIRAKDECAAARDESKEDAGMPADPCYPWVPFPAGFAGPDGPVPGQLQL